VEGELWWGGDDVIAEVAEVGVRETRLPRSLVPNNEAQRERDG
jgi:hypothetical protein